MKKSMRELVRLARDEGLSEVAIVPGGEHMRLVGSIEGKRVILPVSLTKAFACKRSQKLSRLNIRRAIAEARAQ